MTMPTTLLFTDHATAVGGAETSLLLLADHLDRAQWQPHLAGAPGPFLDRAAAHLPIHPTPMPQLRRSPRFFLDWVTAARRLAHQARQLDAPLLYANTVRAALYTALAAKMAQRPFLWHMRDFWLSENKPARLWPDTLGKRLLTSAASLVIANSAATAVHLPPSPKIHIVANGIDVNQFDPALDGRPFRHQFNIPPDAPIVGMVGRLRPWKGQERFLWLAAQIAQTMPDARFLIVGGDSFGVDDVYPRHLQTLARAYQIQDKVTFTGQTDDVRPALAALDLFIHPGDPEPFGLVNIEAMAMGKPVIAFAHGALPEIVQDGATGLLVPPGATEALTTAVLTLLHNPAQRRQMGQAARCHVETHFTIQRTADQIAQLCQSILSP